ncbi:SDR family oxidoreductase [Streptomyces tubercidicus]|uniref:Short-chain dehydrogenase n=1 Tax=Streptomyces tubercidicus TaxID=47759 RepID=A0A640UMM8_9ACTN|nr:SDR family oxidoreductase [Streptomyces tubercidicus]WAU11326.1 SDR family oxidoreductase [Streptomyces tubercidicus]GFE36572.1 short-chain dehydrogenase [Streptomyces tubercidicus]
MLNWQPKPLSPAGRAVVITGASSGLGKDCALHLERRGFRVFAGVRRTEDGARLRAEASSARLRPVLMDVTGEESLRAAAAEVAESVGEQGVWALVNNAGTCLSAPLECVPPDQLRQQLDTNVVGPVAVTQAFLPQLRRSRGRVVNISSGMGSVAMPYLGAYATGQFAKEGMSDAFRRELRPFGVSVSVVKPGAIATPIWDKVREAGEEILNKGPEDIAGRYRAPFEQFLRMNEQRAQSSSTRPEDFARTVFRALTAPRPRTRYCVGPDAWAAATLSRLLPDSVLDRGLSAVTRADRGRSGS